MYEKRTETQRRVNWVPHPEKEEKIVSDPNGMYTGRPKERYEKPVQDADDL